MRVLTPMSRIFNASFDCWELDNEGQLGALLTRTVLAITMNTNQAALQSVVSSWYNKSTVAGIAFGIWDSTSNECSDIKDVNTFNEHMASLQCSLFTSQCQINVSSTETHCGNQWAGVGLNCWGNLQDDRNTSLLNIAATAKRQISAPRRKKKHPLILTLALEEWAERVIQLRQIRRYAKMRPSH